MDLDQSTIKRMATLARLRLDQGRMESMLSDLNRILHFIEELDEVDTSHVDLFVKGEKPSFTARLDTVEDGGDVEKILANAPEVACNMFVVPKVVE